MRRSNNCPGIISFFQSDVPAAFKQVTDPTLLAAFKKSNDGVIDLLKSYQSFLQNELLARSHGDFGLAAELYSKKLLYEEMVDLPLGRLLEIGMADLRRNEEASKKPPLKSTRAKRRSRSWRRPRMTTPRPIICCNPSATC